MHKILILEDRESDIALMDQTLRAAGFDFSVELADNAGDFRRILDSGGVSLILSDCRLPAFSGAEALRLRNELWPQIPFIFITGGLGDEEAAALVAQGADDYLLKDRMARLPAAAAAAIARKVAEAEKDRLRGQLEQSQKMETLGVLAAGIAHDFANILCAIDCYVSMILRNLGDGQLRADVAEIGSACQRGKEITNQLLAFGRKQELSRERLDLRGLVSGAAALLRGLTGERIKLREELGEEAAPVFCDRVKMAQVLLNLAANARDAMPGGGLLRVKVCRCVYDRTRQPGSQLKPGAACALIEVSDNGKGMAPEVLRRAFEPLFTTKAPGKGTGLGLSIVYGIVSQHGGAVEIESAPGQGTTISVFLPEAGQD